MFHQSPRSKRTRVMEVSRASRSFLFLGLTAFLLTFCNGISFKDFVTLSGEQQKSFQEFKTRVKPFLYQDWMQAESFLVRFLRGRRFDVDKAVAWLKEYIIWRKDTNMDNIQNEDWSEIERDYPYTVAGFDREDRPILLYHADEWDIRTAAISGKLKQLNRYFEKMLDEVEIAVRKQQQLKKNVTQGAILIDLRRVNAAQHVNFISFPFYIGAVNSVISRFSQLFDFIALVNTPEIFGVIIDLMTPLMDPYTREAFMVFGKNREQWVPIVRKRIDPDQLPVRYGGNVE